jgi:adenylate cyclase class IV
VQSPTKIPMTFFTEIEKINHEIHIEAQDTQNSQSDLDALGYHNT